MKKTYLTVLALSMCLPMQAAYQVKPLTDAQAREYKLDIGFYKKATEVQDILIVKICIKLRRIFV